MEKIIESIIKCNNERLARFPFGIDEFWKVLNYSQKNNARRSIENNPDYKNKYCYYDCKNIRTTEDIALHRSLFFPLLKERNKGLYDLYFEERKKDLLERLTQFEKYIKPTKLHDTYVQVKGYYYKYNLGSYFMSKDLDICPYECIKILNKTFNFTRYESNLGYIAEAWEYNRERISYDHFPNYRFNSTNHQKRSESLTFLNAILEHYPLDEYQKQLVKTMIEGIKELLYKQANYDDVEKKAKASAEKKRKSKTKKHYNEDEMKRMYREAALKCHPDKNPNGEDIFKNLNTAHASGDYFSVKKIYESLIA